MYNVEKKFLENWKGKKVRVYINNGYQLTGILEEYDETTIVIVTQKEKTMNSMSSVPKLFYKHNISTIELA
ncbi:MAG: RNA chaperone Hfq [Clostridia bacterium]